MSRNFVRQTVCVVGGLALLTTAGCDANLQEAALAGLFDFVSGTVADTLGAFFPVAEALASSVG